MDAITMFYTHAVFRSTHNKTTKKFLGNQKKIFRDLFSFFLGVSAMRCLLALGLVALSLCVFANAVAPSRAELMADLGKLSMKELRSRVRLSPCGRIVVWEECQ